MIGRTDPGTAFDPLSYLNYRDIRDHNTTYSGVAAFCRLSLNVHDAVSSEHLTGALVTSNFFHVLRVPMAAGRPFAQVLDELKSERVAVISYGLWVRRFGSDVHVLGKRLFVNGQPVTVIGVTGKSFRGTTPIDTSDVWVPLGMAPVLLQNWVISGDDFFNSRSASWPTLMARLKPSVSFEQASAETKTIFARLRAAYPVALKHEDVELMRAIGLDSETERELKALSFLLLSIVGFLLLLACAMWQIWRCRASAPAIRRLLFAWHQAFAACVS